MRQMRQTRQARKYRRRIYEDGEAVADGSSGEGAENTAGTTTNSIANYTVRLGDVIRRKQIEEGIHYLNIADNIHVSYYCKNRSNEELKKCFDYEQLRCDVMNVFMRRTAYKDDIKIRENDESILELENAINKNCLANFVITFKEFKQYGTQIVFVIDDKDDVHDNCTVSVHQVF